MPGSNHLKTSHSDRVKRGILKAKILKEIEDIRLACMRGEFYDAGFEKAKYKIKKRLMKDELWE